jgi:hypothetical protein
VARAARRLGAARAGETVGGERLLLALALAAAVVICLGIQSVSFPLAVPDVVLRPALVLAAGGVLTAVTARSGLRLAAGVLLTLTGFGLGYSHLDPGMLIAAGLALFELLFALLASYYLGLGPSPESGPQ